MKMILNGQKPGMAWVMGMAWVVMLAGVVSAGEVAIPIDPDNNVSGSGQGNYSGDITKMTDGSGMNGNGNNDNGTIVGWPHGFGAGLPSTWTNTANDWHADYQALGVLTGATNGKLGWITFDMGTSLPLVNLYFWNCINGSTAGSKGFNLYFATNALAIPSPAKVDYEFSVTNGWTQYGDDDANPTTPRYTMAQGTLNQSYCATIGVTGTTARFVGIEVLTNYGSANRIGLAEFAATYLDDTPPTLGITDDDVDDTIEIYNPVTYTLTFSEDVDPSTVTTGNLSNVAGTAPSSYLVDSITQTFSSTYDVTDESTYDVVVIPTTAGNLQLQVSSNVLDWAGNPMAADAIDAETKSVVTDPTPPEVVSIVDSRGGGPMGAGQSITYIVTFNEHIDAATVSTGDFVNVLSTTVTVTSVTTGALANIFHVDVTPEQAGHLQFRLSSDSIVDKSGNTNDVAWTDAETITVESSDAADSAWDVDASGDWGEVSNWQSNRVARGTDRTATFPDIIGGDRTVTLDTDITIGNITASDGNKNYTISGGNTLTLAVTNGTPTINVTTSGRTLTIGSSIAGSDGLRKTGGGAVEMSGANTFTGGIDISAGTIGIRDNANEQSNLGDAANVLTFSGDATFHNTANTVDMPQGIMINTNVTATLSGAFGERTYMTGVLAGPGTVVVKGGSAGWLFEARSTSNTFTGPIQILGNAGPATLKVASLVDSPAATTIGLRSNGDNGGQFEYRSGAVSPLVFNNRQFELITDGNAANTLDRQTKISNNAGSTNTMTINSDLLITSTGSKKLVLGGGNTGDNTFAGDIPDAIDGGVLHLYKVNGGRWILAGNNTFEGITTVSGGTLVLQGEQAIWDSGTVNIAGGKVEIEVREKVDTLQFNGIASDPAAGTWGSSSSDAANTNDTYFSGDGVLFVGDDFPPSGSVLIVR
jgi:autotransporter-associated beta strand protein